MFDLFLATGFTLFCLAVSWRQSTIAFFGVPLFLTFYFFVSCVIFSFGHSTPVIAYDPTLFANYLRVLLFVNLFWISAFLGMRLGVLCFQSNIVDAEPLLSQRKMGRRRLALRSSLPLELFMFFICLLPGLFILFSTTFDEFWSRGDFTADFTNLLMMGLADTFFWLAAFLAPFLKRPIVRYLALCWIVLSFAAMGERQAPVALFLFVLVERYVLKRGNIIFHVTLLLLMFYILMILIAMRPLMAGGLQQFVSFAISPTLSSVENFFYALNYMTNFSIFVNSLGISAFEVDSRSFLYGINPVPSFIHNDVDYFITQHSIRHYVPLPGFSVFISFLGEYIFFFIVFVVFFLIEIPRRILRARSDVFDRVVYYSLVFVPFLFSLQYNLRSVSRLFYFLLFAYIVFTVVRRLRIKF